MELNKMKRDLVDQLDALKCRILETCDMNSEPVLELMSKIGDLTRQVRRQRIISEIEGLPVKSIRTHLDTIYIRFSGKNEHDAERTLRISKPFECRGCLLCLMDGTGDEQHGHESVLGVEMRFMERDIVGRCIRNIRETCGANLGAESGLEFELNTIGTDRTLLSLKYKWMNANYAKQNVEFVMMKAPIRFAQ